FRIQLLVQREVGAIEKVFTTFDLGYQLPPKYLRAVARAPAETDAAVAEVAARDEAAAHQALWKRIWLDKQPAIAATAAMLAVLTLVFFFQTLRSEEHTSELQSREKLVCRLLLEQ